MLSYRITKHFSFQSTPKKALEQYFNPPPNSLILPLYVLMDFPIGIIEYEGPDSLKEIWRIDYDTLLDALLENEIEFKIC